MVRSRAVVTCRRWEARKRCDRPCSTCRAHALFASSCRRNSSVSPIASAIATATSFAERITIASIASSTLIVWPGAMPSFEGSCAAASEIGIWVLTSCAPVELLEQQVERHHLGDRGRMAQSVFVSRIERPAAVGVNHDRRKLRRTGTAAPWPARTVGEMGDTVDARSRNNDDANNNGPARAGLRLKGPSARPSCQRKPADSKATLMPRHERAPFDFTQRLRPSR